MVVKHFKLSQPEKERLIRIKARTGVQNWNILCRFAGEYSVIYEAIIRQRCINDGLGDDEKTLAKYFRLHLSRGINHYSTRDVLKSCSDLLGSACTNTQEE